MSRVINLKIMKNHSSSIFIQHYNTLMGINEPQELETAILNIVNTSRINEVDKRKIKMNVASYQQNLYKLQYYLTNSMLMFQGLGVIKSK